MRCVNPNDELMECPFDKNHIILKSRIHYHLIKCKIQHPNSTKIQCPYNASEYVEPEEFQKHLYECKERVAIYRADHCFANTLQSEAHGRLDPAPFHVSVPMDDDEYWDTSSSDQTPQSEGTAAAGSRQPEADNMKLLRDHLRKVYGKPSDKPKNPMGRGAMLQQLLESRK